MTRMVNLSVKLFFQDLSFFFIFSSDALDREFKSMVTELPANEVARMRVADRYPSPTASWCRKLFEELDL
jgi:hypothetical protein